MLQAQAPYFPTGAPPIVANPPAPWTPGQVVTFSLTINNFEDNPSGISEYFHGLGIIPGNCWTNLTYGTPPPASNTAGQWLIVTVNPPLPTTGGPRIPGYYFDVGFDNNVTNNWGDGPGNDTWTFTWTAQVPNNGPCPCNFTMAARVFGDGETGNWTQQPPGTQPNINATPFLLPCNNPPTVTCQNTAHNVAPTGTPIPGANYTWTTAPNGAILAGATGFDTVTVIYPDTGQHYAILTATNAGGTVLDIDSFLVNVTPCLPPPSTICQSQTVTITPPGQAVPGLNYAWSCATGTILTGTGYNPVTIAFTNTGPHYAVLTGSNGATAVDIDSFLVNVNLTPNADFTVSRNVVCENDTFLVKYSGIDTVGTTFNWDFGGLTVVSGSAHGPYIIQYSSLQDTFISLYVTTPFCTSDTVRVPVSVVGGGQIVMPDTVCIGEVTNITYSGVNFPGTSFTWNLGSSLLVSSNGTLDKDVVWLNPGIDTIRITTTYLSCVKEIKKAVVINSVASVDAGPDTSICIGSDSLILRGSLLAGGSACQYLWTPSFGLNDSSLLNPKANPAMTTTYYLQAFCGQCTSNVDSVTIFVNSSPIVTATQDTFSFCQGGAGVQLSVTVSGGSGNISYEWFPHTGLSNPFIANPVATPTLSRSYACYVRDLNGCASGRIPVYVNVIDLPKTDAGSDQVICNAGSIQLNGTVLNPDGGAYQFAWSPSTGLNDSTLQNPIASPTTTTVYTFTATSLTSGCTSLTTGLDSVATVTVVVAETPIANAGPDTLFKCNQDTVIIGDFPFGGGPNYTYSWSPNIDISDVNVRTPQVWTNISRYYYLTVTSNGCNSVVDSILILTPDVTVNISDVAICPYDSIQLNPVTTGNMNGTRIEWFPAAGLSDSTVLNPMAQPDTTTLYTIRIYNQLCFVEDQVLVTVHEEPVIVADTFAINNGAKYVCAGVSTPIFATVSTVNTTYTASWSPITGLSDPNSLTPDVNILESTTYILTVTTPNCVFYDTLDVIASPPTNPMITADTSITCQGTPVTLTASGGQGSASFLWTPADGLNTTTGATVIALPMQTTLYTVLVTEGGCSDTAQFLLTVNPQPRADFVPSVTMGCRDLEVNFTNTSYQGVNFTWNFGNDTISNEVNPTYTFTQAGIYLVTLIATGSGGCIDSITQDIVVSEAAEAGFYYVPVSQMNDTVYLPNGEVQFIDSSKHAISWAWDFGDGFVSNQQNPVHEYLAEGDYMVTLVATDSGGCSDTMVVGPVYVRNPIFNLVNVFTPNGDGTNDLFNPGYKGTENYQLFIYDRFGALMFESKNKEDGWNGNTKSGSPAIETVYYYVLQIGDRKIDGSFSLLR